MQQNDLEPNDDTAGEDEPGGFVALAVLAAAFGAGIALMLAPEESARARKRVGRGLRALGNEAATTVHEFRRRARKRRRQDRREKQLFALAGLFVGIGLTALLTPQSGPVTRDRLGNQLSRIRVGAVDRIERLRQNSENVTGSEAERPVRSVQELGRDPNTVF